jgi:type III secretion system FlhB-like substrate exporter
MEKAIAIKYDKELPAPFVLAKGKGELARIIETIARDNGIEITQIPHLADALIDLEIGSFIPEAYYGIIAELLIFVRNLREQR